VSRADMDLLQRMTTYSVYKDDEPVIVWLWEILKKRFNDQQRADFLVFVWGRSRLPVTASDFERRFVIQPLSRKDVDADQIFPMAHTCSFALDLPKYSSLEVTYQRLLWSISNCTGIDAD
jgi:hypothetical protein